MFNINNNFVFRQIKQTDDTTKLSFGNPSYTPTSHCHPEADGSPQKVA